MRKLVIKDLHVAVGDKEILKGIDLTVNSNEVHALMGPNGNGKSTLLNTLMGHPNYKVTQGEIYLDGQDVLSMSVDQRSKAGLFLALQYPSEISGVTNSDFLKAAVNAHRDTPVSLFKFIRDVCCSQLNPKFSDRRRRTWIAALATSLVFAVIHFNFYGVIPLFCLGLLFQFLFIRTKSLWPSIIIHSLNNLQALLLTSL